MERLYIDAAAIDFPAVSVIRSRLAGVPVEILDGPSAVFRCVEAASDPIAAGKRVLYLAVNRGRFLRPCPGTRNYHCCGYQILHVGAFCTMDCAYCILQAYFHPAVLTFFVNHEDLFTELSQTLAERPANVRRLGTGEFTDSLIWEPLSDLNARLVSLFGAQDHAALELKSKSTAVDRLLGLPHNRKTILAFSVNTGAAIRENERRTAPLEARLAAAEKSAAHGFPLAFHFDPMILYPGCEAEYEEVARAIFRRVPQDSVAWVSLGTFRFMPDLKPIVARRFPASKIPYGEFIPGADGKMRYYKPLRTALFTRVAAAIREAAPSVTVYFCMEDDAVWREALGFSPDEKGGLARILDEAASRVCGISI